MANIYKSKYTGAQVDEALGKVATNEQEITNIKTGYIPLKQFTSGPFQIPQIGYNKELNWIDCNVSISAQSIVQRDGNGIIYINPPDTVPENVNEYAAINVGYANKTYVKAINVTENTYVYAASSEGPNGRLRVSPTVEGGIVVQTTADATVRTNDPKNDYDAVNLQYLNKKLASKEAIKDPTKSYFLIKGASISLNNKFAETVTIDWGDGTIETFDETANANSSHTYTDDNTYHLICMSNLSKITESMFHGVEVFTAYFGSDLQIIKADAFYQCNTLQEVILLSDDGLQGSIESGAFSATNLTSFTLPHHCGSIANKAFSETPLEEIISHSSDVIIIASGDTPFINTQLKRIIVPKDSVAAYQAATGWSDFADMIGYEIESSTDIPSSSGDVTLAGNNTFTGTNVFTSNTLEVSDGIDKVNNGKAAIFSASNMKLYDGSAGRNYTIYFPTYSSTLSGSAILVTNVDILNSGYIKSSDNNTFTGSNIFKKSVEFNYGIISINNVSSSSSPNTDGICFTDTSNNTLCWYQGTKWTTNTGKLIKLPTSAGTLALTSDIKIKSASLSGTTLTLTI